MVVEHSAEVKGRLPQVYSLAKTIYLCPEFMPDVKSINVIERSLDGNRIISEWESVVREFRTCIRWTAEDVWDDQTNTCKFSLLKSNHYTYSGYWAFDDLGDRTRFSAKIEITCDLPKFRTQVESFVANRMRLNMDHMLASISARIQRSETQSV